MCSLLPLAVRILRCQSKVPIQWRNQPHFPREKPGSIQVDVQLAGVHDSTPAHDNTQCHFIQFGGPLAREPLGPRCLLRPLPPRAWRWAAQPVRELVQSENGTAVICSLCFACPFNLRLPTWGVSQTSVLLNTAGDWTRRKRASLFVRRNQLTDVSGLRL